MGWANGMAVDSNGDVLLADAMNQLIRRVTPAGLVSARKVLDERGLRTSPSQLAVDASDNLYLSGQGGIRKIDTAGFISTPVLAWGHPDIGILAFSNGTLYGFTTQAVLQTPLP